MQVEKIAMVCHEAIKAYQLAIGEVPMNSWMAAQDWQRQSSIDGVKFRLSNPDAPESAQHDQWMKDKIEDGWVYGEIKNGDMKTHPCIMPFNELSIAQRRKDKLFIAIVEALK